MTHPKNGLGSGPLPFRSNSSNLVTLSATCRLHLSPPVPLVLRLRVAKWPFNTFQANMLKAQALATTQQYLNRFLAEGPDRFMESYMGEWMALTKEILGFDLLAE